MEPYDPNNIFARILRKEIPAMMVHENDHVLAFEDVNKAAPVHVLIIPKAPYRSFADFSANASAAEQQAFFQAVGEVAKKRSLEETGYRLITNHGQDAHQTVPHFHVHLLGGTPLGPLLAGDGKLR